MRGEYNSYDAGCQRNGGAITAWFWALLFWAVSSGKRDITSFHLIHGEEEADGMKGG